MAKLTLWGIRDFYKDMYQTDIFDSINLPVSTKITTSNMKTGVYNTIIANGGEFGVLYPDPVLFMDQIAWWSMGKLPVWQRTLNALELDYNPIENYDRMENWVDTDTGTIKDSGKNTGTNNSAASGKTVSNSENDIAKTLAASGKTVLDGDASETENVSAYNVSTFSPNTEKISAVDNTETNTIAQNENETGTSSNTETNTNARTDKTETTNDSTQTKNLAHNRSGRAHGNIGVTTSQQMLEQEFEIAKVSSIFEIIADDFIRQFCIMVY